MTFTIMKWDFKGMRKIVGEIERLGNEDWVNRVRSDYYGILSEEQIEETIRYWDGIITHARQQGYEAGRAAGLEGMGVLCGKLEEHKDKVFIGGCEKGVSIMRVYACVDCSAPFHRECLLKHIAEDMPVQSLTAMPLEEGLRRLENIKKEGI